MPMLIMQNLGSSELAYFIRETGTEHWQGIHIIVSYICIVHTSFSYTRKFVMWTFGN